MTNNAGHEDLKSDVDYDIIHVMFKKNYLTFSCKILRKFFYASYDVIML